MRVPKILPVLGLAFAFAFVFCWTSLAKAVPVGSAFTYQGHLYDANHVANREYDFQFKLYNDPCSGAQIGSDVNKPDVDVIDGYFLVKLDFGTDAFAGDARWLEIGIRPGALNDPNTYTTLTHRQEVTATPYAIYASSALNKYGEGNLLFVSPTDDLIAKYNWLKSSDRDAVMGALSSDNRRTLVLLPGRYVVTSVLTLDTDYVDITGLTREPAFAIIERNGGGSVLEQTADTITLSGLKIYNSTSGPGEHAFNINAISDNSLSTYRFMEFAITGGMGSSAVYGTSDVNGLWESCKGSGFFLVCAPDSNLAGTFKFCEGGTNSFRAGSGGVLTGTFIHCTAGDSSFNGGTLSGTFTHCQAGNKSFGGGLSVGDDCTGTFRNCVAGDNSFAMGKTFSGLAVDCKGGNECFGGYIGSGGDYPYFTGEAIDCIASGQSFGGGSDVGECSGKLIRCRCTNMETALRVAGAWIDGCYFAVTAGGPDREGIALKDDNTRIYNTTIVCTGYSIKGSVFPKNVLALHCRMNKDKHPNVTNLIGDGSLTAGYCIVDADID